MMKACEFFVIDKINQGKEYVCKIKRIIKPKKKLVMIKIMNKFKKSFIGRELIISSRVLLIHKIFSLLGLMGVLGNLNL